MNGRERFLKIMHFEKPDRGILWEMGYWKDTVARWYSEGLRHERGFPAFLGAGESVRGEAFPHNQFSSTHFRDQDVHLQLGLDQGLSCLPINSGPNPPFELIVFEEDNNYKVYQDEYGIKKRINKMSASIPEFLDWQVKNRKDFQRLKKERFDPNLENRVPDNWPELVEQFRRRDNPLTLGGPPIGFFGFLRYMMGEIHLLTAFYDDPKLLADMMSFFTDFWIELWNQALSQIKVDCVHFWEDMAYRSGPMISPAMFRQFMMPCYRRVCDFLKARGVDVILVDSDGNLEKLIPLFLESGLTGVYPCEVQAGNDVVEMRKNYPTLQILGGLNKLDISRGRKAIDEELEKKVLPMLEAGGYIPFMDHLVPPEVSWDDFCYYRGRLWRVVDGYYSRATKSHENTARQTNDGVAARKHVTIWDVATLAQTSTATVSAVVTGNRYVSDQLKQRVEESIRALDYRPNLIARSLKSSKTKTIGLIFMNALSPFWPRLVRTVQKITSDLGYDTVLVNTDENVEREKISLWSLVSKRVDGIIIARTISDDFKHISDAAEVVPLVAVDRQVPGINSVTLDNKDIYYKATTHLIQHGHCKIGLVTIPLKGPSTVNRFIGYKKALDEIGSYDPSLVREVDSMGEKAKHEATDLLISMDVDAVIATSESTTVGILQAAKELRRKIPENLAVIGFDDLQWMEVFVPSISTIHQPVSVVGKLATNILLQSISGKQERIVNHVVKSSLIIRNSCGCNMIT